MNNVKDMQKRFFKTIKKLVHPLSLEERKEVITEITLSAISGFAQLFTGRIIGAGEERSKNLASMI